MFYIGGNGTNTGDIPIFEQTSNLAGSCDDWDEEDNTVNDCDDVTDFRIDWYAIRDSADHDLSVPIGTTLSNTWVYRFIWQYNDAGCCGQVWFGMADETATDINGYNDINDGAGFYVNDNDALTLMTHDENTPDVGALFCNGCIAQDTNHYIEFIRNVDLFSVEVFSDASYTTSVASTSATDVGITGLDNVMVASSVSSGVDGGIG